MLNIQIAYSGLRASQVAMDTIANNLANATTPGYHRQVVLLQDRPPVQVQNLLQGAGVDAARVQRLRQALVEATLTSNISERGSSEARLDVLQQIETLFATGEGSWPDRLQSFFNQLQELSANPDDALQRRTVLSQASAMTDQVRSLMAGLAQLRSGVTAEIRDLVAEVNEDMAQIAELNQRIATAEGFGFVPNDLWDRRDQVVNELAKIVDPIVLQQGGHRDVMFLAGGSVAVAQRAMELEVETDEAGQLAVVLPGLPQSLEFSGGRLATLLSANNEIITDFESRLQEFTSTLMTTLDHAQATGLGLSGPFDVLVGQRSVTSVDVPLVRSASDFPLSAGTLAVSVTNAATGARQTTVLTIDPATQSLEDVAALLDGVAHLHAIVEPQSGTLSLRADSGYAFDFAGRPETEPDATGITGTTRASLGGTFTGSANDRFTFRALGTGTVGVTPDLAVEVRCASGELVATLDVGLGYEAGQALQVADGVTVSFASGTLNTGDSFTSPMIADADTTGILAALRLNSFFVGSDATTIAVNPLLLENPGLLATSRTGEAGDIGNLTRLLDARDAKLLAQGTQTLEEYVTDVIATVGTEVQDAQLVDEHVQTLGEQLEAERDHYSGVDPNEEMVRLLQFQQAFTAAAKLIVIADETMQELLKVID
jgi:flagellar hook-associated protein FlgK